MTQDTPTGVDEYAINPLHINQECFDECEANNKRKAETAVLMALNMQGVEEQEARAQARIAVDSVF